MWEVIAEAVGWILGVVGAVAGAGIILVLRTLREAERDIQSLKHLVADIPELRREQERQRVELAREQTVRQEMVPFVSRSLGSIERHSEAIARLEERTKENQCP
ncbi:MAG: hypothetical protein OXU42_08310 [Deltaproteobacteria bacterium]|nr:hypothetical protein [Deltaproteobacteria bacterium]